MIGDPGKFGKWVSQWDSEGLTYPLVSTIKVLVKYYQVFLFLFLFLHPEKNFYSFLYL